MCFGGEAQSTKTTTPNIRPEVTAAANQNLDFAANLRDQGFTPYGGQQVADFSGQQQQSFGMVGDIAANDTAAASRGMINSASGAGPQQINTQTGAQNMSPYMNQYVMSALAPQLMQSDMQLARNRAQTNSTATGSGAFGDARTGIEQAQNTFLNNVSREGLIGSAYNNAFNTAVGAGQQDASRNLQGQVAQGQFGEQALQRQFQGATALEGLQNQQLGVAGAVNQMGQQQTAHDQAGKTADYNQWLMAQQYPFQTQQLANQTLAAASGAMPPAQTTVETKPDNSGLQFLGTIAGAAATAYASDIRVKDDVVRIGKLHDGLPVYSFRYKGEPEGTMRIGLMAQDVEKRNPKAVREWSPGGMKMVDYSKATELSRAMAGAI